MSEITDQLHKVSIFERLDGAELDALHKVATTAHFPANKIIFHEGDRSDSMWIILNGSVRVYRTSDEGNEKLISTLTTGSFFGEFAMLDGQPRSASVATLVSTDMLAIEHRTFRAFVDSHPAVMWKVMEALCGRMRQLGADLLDMSFRDVPYRLLRAFVGLADKHGEKRADGLRIDVKITIGDLANMVGSTPENVSRLIQKLQDDGLVRVEAEHFIVPNPRVLERSLEYAKIGPSMHSRPTLPKAIAWSGLIVALLGAAAHAHERFIRHDLKRPLDPSFFLNSRVFRGAIHRVALFGVDGNIWQIGFNTFLLLTVFIGLWFLRRSMQSLVEYRVARPLTGAAQRWLHYLACYVTDRPVKSRGFNFFREWAVIFFLRSPGLVLMYSAANDSLVMPSYPLDPASAAVFKFAQVGLAILILTQTWLPLCGAMIIGTWFYLFRWGWMVSIDAVPVLTVAVIYCTSPWQSHKLAITDINPKQMRYARIVLGAGFFVLGWLKIYNHNLTAGVADNYPSVMNDPVVKLLAFGTDPRYLRECWIVSFACAEIMSGFLLMIGVFSRLWATIMTFMFTKLMLVDFGWEEIPHLYPIAAMLTVITSNKLTCELDWVEAHEEKLWRKGHFAERAAAVALPSVLVAFLVLFPMMYFISLFDRSSL